MSGFDGWIEHLADPMVLVGFYIMLFTGVLKLALRLGGNTITRTSTAKLVSKGLTFVFVLGVLIILLSFGLKFSQVLKEDNPSPMQIAEAMSDTKYLDAYVQPLEYSEWQIEESNLPHTSRQGILRVLKLFRDGKYSSANSALSDLSGNHPFVDRFKDDFRTAILFAEGDYDGALESILDRYQGRPIGDISQRWEIAYVIYFYRKYRGLRECEEAIQRLQERYRRADISYAWMAIHPGAMKRLLERDLHPYQDLDPVQIDLLEYVISKHPDDPFVDHAHYFLHNYDTIISRFPTSIILDRAYYSKAYRKYRLLLNDPYRVPSDDDLAGIAGAYSDFVSRFQASELTEKALGEMSDCVLRMSDPVLREARLRDLLRDVASWNSPGLTNELRQKYSAVIGNQLQYRMSDWEPEYSEWVLQSLQTPEEVGWIDLDPLKLCIARKAFSCDDYGRAFRFYDDLSVDAFPKFTGEDLRLGALRVIHDITDQPGSKEHTLKMAYALKSTKYDAAKAIPYFAHYLREFASTTDRAKYLMLQAFCCRDSDRGEEMASSYMTIVEECPESNFSDDALAELGVYHLLWGIPDYGRARQYFQLCISRYPLGNAVDNCHNWIAWSYMQEHNYRAAYAKYSENIRLFPTTRFAIYAAVNMRKLNAEGRI